MNTILLTFLVAVASFAYLKLFGADPIGPLRVVWNKLRNLGDDPTWKLRRPKFLPGASKAVLNSIAGTGVGLWTRLYRRIFRADELAEEEDDEKYQAGESYGDPSVVATSLVKDLRAIGMKVKAKDLRTLIEIVKNKGKPMDDRQMHVSFLSLYSLGMNGHGLTIMTIDRWRKSLP